MTRFAKCFVLVVIVGCVTKRIGGDKVPSQTLRIVVRNTAVTLRCPRTSREQSDHDVSWFFSSYSNPPGFMKSIADDDHFKLDTESDSLIIRNVTIEDAGQFICCLGACLDTFLVVLDFGNVLSFAPDMGDASGEIVVSSKGDFSITAHHGSEFEVEIFKEPNIPMCNQLSGYVVCDKMKRRSSTSYYLKNVNLQTSGRLVIQSSFMNFSGSYGLNMLVQGKPEISMKRIHTDDGINFVCYGHAYPPPVFEFRIIPSDMGHPDLVSSILLKAFVTSNHSTQVNATGTVKHPNGPGIVECTASNSEGVSYAVASLLIDNFIDETRDSKTMSSSTESEQLQFEITSPFGSINLTDTVQLECNASFDEFSNSFIFQFNGTRYLVVGVQQNDTWVANFSMIASSAEEVICIAQFRNGSQMSKPKVLPFEPGSHASMSNENDLVLICPTKLIDLFQNYHFRVGITLLVISVIVVCCIVWCCKFVRKCSHNSIQPTATEVCNAFIDFDSHHSGINYDFSGQTVRVKPPVKKVPNFNSDHSYLPHSPINSTESCCDSDQSVF